MQLENHSENGDAAAIVVIKCPKCSTPIRKSNRYAKLLNERAMQIDKVKKKLLGDKTTKELLAEWDNLKQILVANRLSMFAVTYREKEVGKQN
jgi:ribosomal protein L32